MKIIKIGNLVGLKNLETDEIGTLLKMQIPMTIIFLDTKTKTFYSEGLHLERRHADFGIHQIENNLNLSINQIINYIINTPEEFDETDEFELVFLIQQSIYIKKQPLIELINKIPKEVYQSCVAIEFDEYGETFKIINLDNEDGTSEKFIYYNINDTYLIFNQEGPKLVTDDPSVNSILDIIKK